MTAAAAVESCPAFHTSLFAQYICFLEVSAQVKVYNTGIYSTYFICFFPNKLMTRIQIPFRTDCQIIMACPAAAQTFWQARTTGQVYVKVEEVIRLAFFVLLYIMFAQFFILSACCEYIFVSQCIVKLSRCYYRFHGQFTEAQLYHMCHVGSEISVVVCISTAQIIFFPVSVGYEFLEFFHDQIVRAFPIWEFTHIIVSAFSAVQAQYSADAFFVQEVLYFFGEQYTVGGHGEFEDFVVDGTLFFPVFHQFTAYVKVQQRLTAKEIDLNMFTMFGCFD